MWPRRGWEKWRDDDSVASATTSKDIRRRARSLRRRSRTTFQIVGYPRHADIQRDLVHPRRLRVRFKESEDWSSPFLARCFDVVRLIPVGWLPVSSAWRVFTTIAFRFSFDDFHSPIRPINIFIFIISLSSALLESLCFVSSLLSFSNIYGRSVRFADVKFFVDTSKMVCATSSDSSCHQRFALLTSIYHAFKISSPMSPSSNVSKAFGRTILLECTICRCKNVFIFFTFSRTSSLIWVSTSRYFVRYYFSYLFIRPSFEIHSFIPLDFFPLFNLNVTMFGREEIKWMASHSKEVTARSRPRGRSRHRTPHRSLGRTAEDDRWGIPPRSRLRYLLTLESILELQTKYQWKLIS